MFRTFTCASSGVLIYKVVSLPHVVLCPRCCGCGPTELVCSHVHCLSVSNFIIFLMYLFLLGRSRDRFPVVSLYFPVTYSFRPYHDPGVYSAPSENEYQEHFLRVQAAGVWGWQPRHLHVPNVMEIWESKPPGTLWATPGLLRDSLPLPFIFFRLSTNPSSDIPVSSCVVIDWQPNEGPSCLPC